MTDFTITDSKPKPRTVNVSSDDEMIFIIKFENKKIGEFILESSEEDGIYIQFMNIYDKDFQGCGIGTKLLEILTELHGKDIHQPFEKYKFHDINMGYPRVDSESERLINNAIEAGILNEYKVFHREQYDD